MGGSAIIQEIAAFTATVDPPAITWVSGEDNAETRAAAQTWVDLHSDNPTWIRNANIWERKVMAPGMGNSDRDLTVAGSWPSGTVPPLPMTYSWEGPTSLSLPVTCTVTNLTLCRKRTNASYDDRQSPMDFTDQTVADTWYADEYATVTVTGGGLSATGTLAGAGAEVNMGTVFLWSGSIVNNHFPAANTTYGRIASPTCFGQDASLAATLYKPHAGGAEDEPDPTNYSGWGRTAPTSGEYLKLIDDGGIALQRSAVSTSGGTGGCRRSAPVTLNYKGLYARQFDPDGDTPSGLLVSGEPRSWVDGAWVLDEWACGSDYSKTMMWRSELFSYEWQFLTQGGTCWVTQASRVAQGEDVGGATIAQNDAQCAIICQGLNSGITGEPHWAGWLTLAHTDSIDVNDPPGAASRPSLWTGGTGVTVDLDDNDAWTVAAGTGSPAVSRSLASRYPLRMARLANPAWVPGLEYGADWPYILRRSRAGETYDTFTGNEDDTDWWDSSNQWTPSEAAPEYGRIDTYEGVDCSGICAQFVQRFAEAKWGEVFEDGPAGPWWMNNVGWLLVHPPQHFVWSKTPDGCVPGDLLVFGVGDGPPQHIGIMHGIDEATGGIQFADSNNLGDSLGRFLDLSQQPSLTLLGYLHYQVGVPIEDVWNWSNFSYLAVGITAPKVGTVTLKLTVQVPTLSDPCYTSAEDRWSEFEFSETTRTFSYSVPVVAGANAVQVDLCKPAEGMVPEGEYRLCRVETVQFGLPAAGGTDDEWALTDLRLCEDEENTPSVFWHNKRAWGWRSACWFGFGAMCDGKPGLQVDPGYRRLSEEWGLQYIQFRQHDPDSELTDELSYAKVSERLAMELDWQEGFTCTWGDPLADANNTDADDIAFAPQLYWWDHRHEKQSSAEGCVCTGKLSWVYGAEYDVYYSVFPRGEVCGLSYTGKQRNRRTGTVWLYRCETGGGTYSRLEECAPNSQGLWHSDPVLEKGWFYGVAFVDLGATVSASGLRVSGLQVSNREYTFAGIISAVFAATQAVAMFTDPAGLVPWTAWIDGDGAIKLVETDSGQATPGTVRTVDSSGDYDSVYVAGDSVNIWVDARNAAAGTLWRFYSTNLGETWTGPVQLG